MNKAPHAIGRCLLAVTLAVTCFTASARKPLMIPSFTEDQEQVRILTARNQRLMSSIASLFGITEARLQGDEEGRFSYYIAQYMTYLESERSSMPTEAKQFVRKTLRDQEWAFAVIRPLEEEARSQNSDLCDVRVEHVSCLYYILSKDMRVRVELLQIPSNAK